MNSASPPSLDYLLASLKSHLHSANPFHYLPTILSMFAHFQIVSHRLKSESKRAMALQVELVELLEARGVEPLEQVRMGALGIKDGRKLRRIQDRDVGDEMLRCSLDMRMLHLATVLAAPQVPLPSVLKLVEAYFPTATPPSLEDRTSDAGHVALYLRSMTGSQQLSFEVCRQTVRQWFRETEERERKRRRRLQIDYMMQGRKATMEGLAEVMERMAEEVVNDVKVMMDIFSEPSRTGEESIAIASRRQNSGQASQSPPSLGTSSRSQLRSQPSHSEEHSLNPIKTPTRPARSPSPESLARLPRLSIDRSRGRSRPRMSLERRTPLGDKSIISVEDVSYVSGGGDTSFDGTQAPHTGSSGAKKRKRPRTSGLPPLTGPDYTAASPKMGENVDKSMMRPFPDSKLHRLGKRGRPSNLEKEHDEDQEDRRE